LIFDLPRLQNYEQVAWVDSDVLFNTFAARDLFSGVPADSVGAVDSFGDPSPEDNAHALSRTWLMASRDEPSKVITGRYNTPDDVYRLYGNPVEPVGRMINGGIFVASPRRHGRLFREVYECYEDKGNPSYYENVPLSYELVKRNLVYWMDPRFNHLWAWSKALHYPFLQERSRRSFSDKILRRAAKWCGNNYEERVAILCATCALLNCYCLHFAGCAEDMRLVDLEMASSGVICNLGIW